MKAEKELSEQIVEAIKKFRDKKNLLITYEELGQIPLNVVQPMIKENPEAIECTRITSNNPDTLMFTVSMQKNQVWESHHHDCKELCVVYKGRLREVLKNKVANPAQSLEFEPNQTHFVVAEEPSIFYVEFKKPE